MFDFPFYMNALFRVLPSNTNTMIRRNANMLFDGPKLRPKVKQKDREKVLMVTKTYKKKTTKANRSTKKRLTSKTKPPKKKELGQ